MSDEKIYLRATMFLYFLKGNKCGSNGKQDYVLLMKERYKDGSKSFGMETLVSPMRTARSISIDKYQISSLIESNPRYTTREIPKFSVENHLRQLVRCLSSTKFNRKEFSRSSFS